MDGTAPFFPHLDSDFSSGYLEDALLEFSERSKRRRLLVYSDHDQTNGLNDLAKVILDFLFQIIVFWTWLALANHFKEILTGSTVIMQNYWNSSCNWDLSENFSCMSQITSINGVSGN